MIDTKKALATATRHQYFGRSPSWLMKASRGLERVLEKTANGIEHWRRFVIRRTLKEMWPVGTRVTTLHGNGLVIENKLIFNTFSLGGWIETDVRYDHAPADAPNEYPHVGHYNQIFLEPES